MHTAPLLKTIAAVCGSAVLAASCSLEGPDPAAWNPPGVAVGEGLLVKTRFARIEGLDEICDVTVGKVEGDERTHLVVSGWYGYALLDPASGEVRSRVPFEQTHFLGDNVRGSRSRALDVDGDGRLEFVRFGEHWSGKTSVHGVDGKALWIYSPGEDLAPNLTECGDLDGDGKLEFFMAYNATDEVHLLNSEGELLWSQEWSGGALSSGDVHLFDADGDGTLEILYINGQALCVRDGGGELLSRCVPPQGGYVNALEIVEGWGDPPEQHLFVGSNVTGGKQGGQQFYVFTAAGTQFIETVAWEDLQPYVKTLPVHFPGAEEVLLARWYHLDRQAFPAGIDVTRLLMRLFDPGHQLVYEEIIKAEGKERIRGGGVFVIPSGGASSSSRLMAAYGSDLWEYALPE